MGVSSIEPILKGKILISKLVNIAVVFLTLAMLSLSVYHFRFQFQTILRVWSMETYVEKMERTVPVARWINANLPLSSKILVLEEPRLFYFDRSTVLDYDFDVRTKYKSSTSTALMAMSLKQAGVTHVLDMVPLNQSASLTRPIDSLLSDSTLVRQEVSLESQNIRENRYRYILYFLR